MQWFTQPNPGEQHGVGPFGLESDLLFKYGDLKLYRKSSQGAANWFAHLLHQPVHCTHDSQKFIHTCHVNSLVNSLVSPDSPDSRSLTVPIVQLTIQYMYMYKYQHSPNSSESVTVPHKINHQTHRTHKAHITWINWNIQHWHNYKLAWPKTTLAPSP